MSEPIPVNPPHTQLARDAYATTKRHRDALAAQAGASNALALANSLVSAIRDTRAAGKSERTDSACRMIAHQLSYLLETYKFDSEPNEYARAVAEIEAQVKASPRPE